jgi:hypothetical protein
MSGLAATVTDLYARARRALADGDAASWEAARAMTELSDMGQSQRQIADGVGCSQQTVSNYVRVYRYHVRSKSLPAFREAMLEVRGGTWGNELPKAPEKRAAIAAELLSE